MRSIVWVAAAGCTVAAVGAVGLIGSDAWLAAGYRSAAPALAASAPLVVGDETFWLAQRSIDVAPAATTTGEAKLRLAALMPAAPSGREFDIVRVVTLPPIAGEPILWLVSARDPDAPGRMHRFVVEADSAAGSAQAKSL